MPICNGMFWIGDISRYFWLGCRIMLSTLVLVAVLHWVALVTPGPNFIVVSSLAAGGSRRAAVFAAVGVTVVAGIWSSLTVLGINAIFSAHSVLRLFVQISGGLYVVFVGTRLWRSGAVASIAHRRQISSALAFRVGFLTNITNPKSPLFFGGIFAASLPPSPSPELLLLAVVVVILNALTWHIFLALSFSHPNVQSIYARYEVTIGRIAGTLVGAIGIRLLYSAVSEARAGL